MRTRHTRFSAPLFAAVSVLRSRPFLLPDILFQNGGASEPHSRQATSGSLTTVPLVSLPALQLLLYTVSFCLRVRFSPSGVLDIEPFADIFPLLLKMPIEDRNGGNEKGNREKETGHAYHHGSTTARRYQLLLYVRILTLRRSCRLTSSSRRCVSRFRQLSTGKLSTRAADLTMSEARYRRHAKETSHENGAMLEASPLYLLTR